MTTEIEQLIQIVQKLSADEQNYLLNAIRKLQGAQAQVESLAQLRALYPNEWIAIVIPANEDKYAPEWGYLIAHSADRAYVWSQVHAQPEQDVYVFFNGPILPKGFTVTFNDTADLPDVAKVVDHQ